MESFYSFIFILSCSIAFLLLFVYVVEIILKNKKAHHIKNNIASDFLMIIETGNCKIEKLYKKPKQCLLLMEYYITTSQNITFTSKEKKRIIHFLFKYKIDYYLIKQLKSHSIFQRCIAVYYLGYLPEIHIRKSIQKQFENEKSMTVKGYFIRTLCLLHDTESISAVIETIKTANDIFIKKLSGLMTEYPVFFIELFNQIKDSKNENLIKFVIDFVRIKQVPELPQYLMFVFLDHSISEKLRKNAFECIMEFYPEYLSPVNFIDAENKNFENIAITFLGTILNKNNFEILLEKAKKSPDSAAITSLSNMVQKGDDIFMYAKEKLKYSTDITERKILARILSIRFEYFLPNLINSTDRRDDELVLSELLHLGKFDSFISFMNQNTDLEIENRLIEIIQSEMNSIDITPLKMYLKKTILEKIGIEKIEIKRVNTKGRNEIIKKNPLVILLCVIFCTPVIGFICTLEYNYTQTFQFIIGKFINGYLEVFSFYAFMVDCFYFLLLILSSLQSRKERRFYELKNNSLLFQSYMLPSVTILAPAFCEEKTIIENVTSLLNLKYPDFEIVIINDGSTDKTLETLINYFHLQKRDYLYHKVLKTSEILGIYVNPDIPGLKVIDKVNGGKADSLNAGINMSSKDYILGIDSDCILETDALLHLTAPFIDEDKPVIAAGGVIMPVNGCTVQNGIIKARHIPTSIVPVLQTLEYYRAFMNGRIGWSKLQTLMIISGAFGLFRKDLMIENHGYLTTAEKYSKDTVGEDMELLIRIVRNMKEQKRDYKVLYSSEALCWTEVPVSIKNLIRQRNRWQRGLIDILLFHKKMFLNPKYGSYGMFGFPYFWIAEVVAPWFQSFALWIFVAGIILGLLSPFVILFAVTTNFTLALANTIIALHNGNQHKKMFPGIDQLKLLGWSFIEVLGFSQFVAALRVSGYISVLKNIQGWKKFGRKGFKKEESS